MGQLNKRALLARLQVMGTASRAGLAKSLGLSQPTAGKIVEEMLKTGLLQEVNGDPQAAAEARRDQRSTAPAALGRPGRIIQLNRTQLRFIAINWGCRDERRSLPVGLTETAGR